MATVASMAAGRTLDKDLTLLLPMSHWTPFADDEDQDQIVENVQSDL